MLSITIPDTEYYDERANEFFVIKGKTIQLEHSLVSLSKWESKWKKPFLSKEQKTTEEILDYIRCMTITQNVDPKIYIGLTQKNLEEIRNYIDDPMTATTISNVDNRKHKNEILTAEVIYYYMTALNIPIKFEKWHLNRLFMLLQVCSIKNSPPKKMSKDKMLSDRRALNAKRKKALHTRG